jgi:hypothetical protein
MNGLFELSLAILIDSMRSRVSPLDNELVCIFIFKKNYFAKPAYSLLILSPQAPFLSFAFTLGNFYFIFIKIFLINFKCHSIILISHLI